jgi:hypothetical protein
VARGQPSPTHWILLDTVSKGGGPVSSDGSEGSLRAGENAFADRRRYHRRVSDPRARITFLLAGGGWPRQSSPSHAVY